MATHTKSTHRTHPNSSSSSTRDSSRRSDYSKPEPHGFHVGAEVEVFSESAGGTWVQARMLAPLRPEKGFVTIAFEASGATCVKNIHPASWKLRAPVSCPVPMSTDNESDESERDEVDPDMFNLPNLMINAKEKKHFEERGRALEWKENEVKMQACTLKRERQELQEWEEQLDILAKTIEEERTIIKDERKRMEKEKAELHNVQESLSSRENNEAFASHMAQITSEFLAKVTAAMAVHERDEAPYALASMFAVLRNTAQWEEIVAKAGQIKLDAPVADFMTQVSPPFLRGGPMPTLEELTREQCSRLTGQARSTLDEAEIMVEAQHARLRSERGAVKRATQSKDPPWESGSESETSEGSYR